MVHVVAFSEDVEVALVSLADVVEGEDAEAHGVEDGQV